MKANISIVNKDEPNIVLTIADHIGICRTFKNKLLNFRFSILNSFRENCIHTKINQDFLLHIQNQKFKGLLCTVEILQKTVKLRN